MQKQNKQESHPYDGNFSLLSELTICGCLIVAWCCILVLRSMSKKQAILKTKEKESVMSQKDGISELPDDILYSIVSYFTMRDAMNASLVSSKWRHLCASMSNLNFDLRTMFLTHNKCVHEIHPCVCVEYKDRFVRGVNGFLQYQKGSRLVSFRVAFCLDSGCATDIDRWVSFALNRRVKHLNLGLSCTKQQNFEGRSFYYVRSELLSHRKAARIRRLCFKSCILGPGVIDKFSFIKDLRLAHMPLGQENVESIISCCMNLKSMALMNCSLAHKLRISGSLPRLSFLAVLRCSNLMEIELSAAKLVTFDYAGDVIRFSFYGLHNLKRVFFRVDHAREMQYVFRQLAKDLPLVKRLSVFSSKNWVRSLPEDITTFSNLKGLKLFCSKTDLDVGRIFAILRACPVLEEFNLVVRSRVHMEQGAHLVTELVNKHLKKVHIGGFYYCTSFIEWVTYLLQHSPALERLVLDKEKLYYRGGKYWKQWGKQDQETWDEEEREKVRGRLQEHAKSALIIIG